MTVGELLQKLLAMPQDALVLVDAYEDGQDPPDTVQCVLSWPVPPTPYTGGYRVQGPLTEPEDIPTTARRAVWISCRA